MVLRQPPMLSLMQMCCQRMAVQFWRKPRLAFKLNYGGCYVYSDLSINWELKCWIDDLGIPKTIEDDLKHVVLAFGYSVWSLLASYRSYPTDLLPYLRAVFRGLEIIQAADQIKVDNFYDALALSPHGGVLVEKTILNLLQSPRTENSVKYRLAAHFWMYDPEVAEDLESYIRKLNAGPGPRPMSFMGAIHAADLWGTKYFWKTMSQTERATMLDRIREVVANVKSVCNSHKRVRVLAVKAYFLVDFLLDCLMPMTCSKSCTANCFNGLFCANSPMLTMAFFFHIGQPFGNVINKFLDRIDKIAFADNPLMLMLDFCITWMIKHNKHFLFPVLESLWCRQSSEFKQNFGSRYFTNISRVVNCNGHIDVQTTLKILTLLRPLSLQMQLDVTPEFVAKAFERLSYMRDSLKPLDEFLKQFVGYPDQERLAKLKKDALMSDYGQTVMKKFNNCCPQVIYKLLDCTFTTAEEKDGYIAGLLK